MQRPQEQLREFADELFTPVTYDLAQEAMKVAADHMDEQDQKIADLEELLDAIGNHTT